MRLVLARARDDGEASAARLEALGHTAILLPVIEIATLLLREAPRAGAVVATSRRAFPALAGLPPHERAELLARPLYAVGEATAGAGAAVGFTDIRVAAGDAEALAKLIAGDPATGPLLYLAGADRKPTLEAALARLGRAPALHVAYEARPRDWSPQDRAQAREAAQAGAGALHYSRRAASLFVAQMRAAGLDGALKSLRHYALSADAAAPLTALGLRVETPAQPSESALFALLPG